MARNSKIKTVPRRLVVSEGGFVDIDESAHSELTLLIDRDGDKITPAMLFGTRGHNNYYLGSIVGSTVPDSFIQTFGCVYQSGLPNFEMYQNWYSGLRCGLATGSAYQVGWWFHEDDIDLQHLVPALIEIETLIQSRWWSTSINVNIHSPPELLLLSSRVRGRHIFRAFRLNSSPESCRELTIRFSARPD